MTVEINSPAFKAIIDTVRTTTILECKKELNGSESWVSIKSACSRLNISRGTLKKLIDEGKIRSKHIGKCVRISILSINRFTNS